jgi:hypothetical protein
MAYFDSIWPGTKMFVSTFNAGYPHEKEEVKRTFLLGDMLTVKSINVGNWSTSIVFEEVHGSWNSVFFDKAF